MLVEGGPPGRGGILLTTDWAGLHMFARRSPLDHVTWHTIRGCNFSLQHATGRRMENPNLTSRESEVPEKNSGGDEDPTEQTRNFIGLATGVAGTVAAFLVGFGILPNISLSEQLLNFFEAIGLSGAIIAGIGAWRSVRRFIVMSIFIAVAFICLAALAIVVKTAGTSQSAIDVSHAPYAPASSASSLPVASPNGPSATASAGSSTGSPTSGNSPASSNGYAPEYSGQGFSIPGGGCSDNSYYPYVLFTAQAPYSDANDYNSSGNGPNGTYDNGAYDVYLDCFARQIDFHGQAAIISGKPDAEACAKRINSYPIAGGTLDFSQLSAGMQFCLLGVDGNNLVYVKLITVSDTSYTTTWVATAWTIPANN